MPEAQPVLRLSFLSLSRPDAAQPQAQVTLPPGLLSDTLQFLSLSLAIPLPCPHHRPCLGHCLRLPLDSGPPPVTCSPSRAAVSECWSAHASPTPSFLELSHDLPLFFRIKIHVVIVPGRPASSPFFQLLWAQASCVVLQFLARTTFPPTTGPLHGLVSACRLLTLHCSWLILAHLSDLSRVSPPTRSPP